MFISTFYIYLNYHTNSWKLIYFTLTHNTSQWVFIIHDNLLFQKLLVFNPPLFCQLIHSSSYFPHSIRNSLWGSLTLYGSTIQSFEFLLSSTTLTDLNVPISVFRLLVLFNGRWNLFTHNTSGLRVCTRRSKNDWSNLNWNNLKTEYICSYFPPLWIRVENVGKTSQVIKTPLHDETKLPILPNSSIIKWFYVCSVFTWYL